MKHVAVAALLVGSVAACTFMGDDGDPARPEAVTGAPGGPPAAPPRVIEKQLSPVAPPFDVASTAATIDAWPMLVPGVTTHSITSFDRSGGNDDGFAGTYSDLYVDARGEHVMFDERGPGVVRTFWMTSGVNGDALLDLGLLRFYFDGEDKPRFVADADALFRGKAGAPFLPELVFDNKRSSGGYVSFAPLPYRKRLRITTEKQAGFHQIHFDRLPADWDIESANATRGDERLAALFARGPSASPLEEIGLDATKMGEGTIDVLRFEPSSPLTEDVLRTARIKVWFDSAQTAQVDAPLGAFFGSGLGIAPVQSIAWTMKPDAYESRMPMPYFENVHLKIEGALGKLRIHVGAARSPRAAIGYLETRAKQELPTTDGKDFFYATTRGTGKLVAHVLTVDPPAPDRKQWWEGDMKTNVDGAPTPSIHGTGHEDDFFGGWSTEFLSRPFSLPMNGCPKSEVLDPTGQLNARATMYRLFPGVSFFSEIRHVTEHGYANNRTANYTALTFMYRQPKARLVLTDAFDVAKNTHDYAASVSARESLASAFEGSGEKLTATVDRYRPGTDVRFTMQIDEDNAGVVLRRLFDGLESPAEAKLVVDDVVVGFIGGPRRHSPDRRWVTEDIFIPAQITRGKLRITIGMTALERPVGPERADAAIGAARFEAFTLRR